MTTVFLFHVLDKSTPLFAGAADMEIRPQKSTRSGDSCNTSRLSLPRHAGTHVDAPYHFVDNGNTVDAYQPDAWIFGFRLVLDIAADPATYL